MKTLPEAKTDTVDFFVFQYDLEEFVATVTFQNFRESMVDIFVESSFVFSKVHLFTN